MALHAPIVLAASALIAALLGVAPTHQVAPAAAAGSQVGTGPAGPVPGTHHGIEAAGPAPGARPVLSQRSARKVLYLTFDDGPLPSTTDRLLRALRRHNAKATFFVVGYRAAAHPSVIRRIARAGHGLGNHTYSHPYLTRVPTVRIRSELQSTARVLGGRASPCMRPPYGATDARVVSEARRLGLTQVRWTADTLDWRRPGVAALVARFQQYTRPGAIILAHDVHLDTVRAVERMLPRWRAQGYSLRVVPACRR